MSRILNGILKRACGFSSNRSDAHSQTFTNARAIMGVDLFLENTGAPRSMQKKIGDSADSGNVAHFLLQPQSKIRESILETVSLQAIIILSRSCVRHLWHFRDVFFALYRRD